MSEQWEQGICNDKSGFLFSHPCPRAPSETCTECEKPICEDHMQLVGDRVLCKSCVKNGLRRKGRGEPGRRYGRSEEYDYYDDPYFYGGYYYSGYGYYGRGYWGYDSYHHATHHDSNDFTEADAESLAYEGDEDFENEMGES